VPPFTGIAEYMTDVPAHTVVALALIARLTGNNGLTAMVTVFEVAGFPMVHVSLEFRIHVIVFPLNGTKEYDALVAPGIFAPFCFH
jgi:hypothetical protein